MKTSELKDLALDWAVGQCEGVVDGLYIPSTSWAQGGPIIEREGVQFVRIGDVWEAWIDADGVFCHGPTQLIAAMRCYVASKLGDEIDVPDELLEEVK